MKRSHHILSLLVALFWVTPACQDQELAEETKFSYAPAQVEVYWDDSFWLGRRSTYHYNDDGQLTGVRWVNMTRDGQTAMEGRSLLWYDEQNRLSSWIYQPLDPATATWQPMQRHSNAYNANGQRKQVIGEEWDGDRWAHIYTEDYVYTAGRLTRISHRAFLGTGSNWDEEYTYDENGRLLSYRTLPNEVTRADFEYDSSDRIAAKTYRWDWDGPWPSGARYLFEYGDAGIERERYYMFDDELTSGQWLETHRITCVLGENGMIAAKIGTAYDVRTDDYWRPWKLVIYTWTDNRGLPDIFDHILEQEPRSMAKLSLYSYGFPL